MEIENQEKNGINIISITGRVDAYTSEELEKNVQEKIDEGFTKLVFNFEGVTYVSSSGLRVLLATLKRLKIMDGALRLVKVKKHIKEIFEISGFAELFVFYDNLEEALNSF